MRKHVPRPCPALPRIGIQVAAADRRIFDLNLQFLVLLVTATFRDKFRWRTPARF